jgi:hypothetical protein
MLQLAASTTQALREVFVINPQAKIRAALYYPMLAGHNEKVIVPPLPPLVEGREAYNHSRGTMPSTERPANRSRVCRPVARSHNEYA